MSTKIVLQPPAYKIRWREICAILPVYLEDGTNGTEITYLDGAVEQIDKRLCWVLDDLLFHLQSSTSVLTRQSRMVLGKTAQRVPLILKPEFSLVPVKGRQKLGEYDTVTGYIVLRHAACIEQDKNGVYIRFQGGARVRVYDNARVLKDKIRLTNTLQETMKQPSQLRYAQQLSRRESLLIAANAEKPPPLGEVARVSVTERAKRAADNN